MAFVISKATKFKWPVEVELPQDGGRHVKETFDVEFRKLTSAQVQELRDTVLADKADGVAIVKSLIVGWSGVQDESKNEIPFSDSALNDLLSIPNVAGGIINAFFIAHNGAQRKNS